MLRNTLWRENAAAPQEGGKSVREIRSRRKSLRRATTFEKMPVRTRHLAIVLAVTLPACGLGGCGTINEKLSAGVSDAIPQWAGGLPRDAPPRPGTAEYDAFMSDRERKRLEPAAPTDAAAKSSTSLPPLH